MDSDFQSDASGFMLTNLVVVVTGGAGGIGAEYAQALAAAGAQVVVIDRDVANGNEIASRSAGRIEFYEADALDYDAVLWAFNRVESIHGKLDVLVNNVGIYPHQSFDEITLKDWQRVLHTNLDSLFICTKVAYGLMKPRKRGKIVNVATNLVWMMVPDMAHYITSKAGVVGFTQAVANEFGKHGITINALAPGANIRLDEDLSERDIRRMRMIVGFQAIKRPQVACDLTGAMLFLCSPHSDFMTGQTICVDGGLAVH